MRTHLHVHTKPPSGQGLTLTLKGLCLAPVIATPQAGFVVSISTSTPLCVYERARVVCETANSWSELSQTPKAPRAWLSHGLVCMCALWFVFCVNNWETTAVSPTMLREAEQLCLWRRFVCGGGETGNEIMLRALAVCAQSLSKSWAGAGRRIPITY